MTDNRDPRDEQLLDHLRDALDSDVEASDDTISMLMTGYDIVHADTVAAELTFDSHVAAGVRDAGGIRQLRFEHESVRIDVDLDDVGLRCTGSVEPTGGALRVEQVSGVRSVELSVTGGFSTVIEGVGPFRFVYEVVGESVASDWIQFQAPDA